MIFVFRKGDICWHDGFGYYIHRSMTATVAEVAQRCKKVAVRDEDGKTTWLVDEVPGWNALW
jgi:hypothetical protein